MIIASISIPFAKIDDVPEFVPINRYLRRIAVQSFNSLCDGNYINVLDCVSCEFQGKEAISFMRDKGLPKDVIRKVLSSIHRYC